MMRINIFLVLALLMVFSACRDRNTEKKIAELESRLADLEGKKASGQPAAVSGAKSNEKPEGPLPVIQFEKTEHDFGTIKEGEVVEHTFTFTNTGEAPLIIQNAQPSCGCTVPDWSRDPIPPGGKGYVKAKFDSKGRPGVQNKTISVTANTWPQNTTLRFKVMVTSENG